MHGEAAFEKEIAVRSAMLDRSLAFGQDNAFMIAACHQALGSAYVLVDDYPAAEFHYRKCLTFEAELASNPTLAANVWSGIQLTSSAASTSRQLVQLSRPRLPSLKDRRPPLPR